MNNQATDLENKLFNNISSEMSETDLKLLFEQYKLYVTMMDKVSDRRHYANSFFLSVNTALITILAGFISLTKHINIQNYEYGWVIFAAIAGIIFCLSWRRLIRSYGQLNKGKFKIIYLLETRLPARIFDTEWDALNRGDGTVYKPFTHTEVEIPLVFAGLYILLGLFTVFYIIF